MKTSTFLIGIDKDIFICSSFNRGTLRDRGIIRDTFWHFSFNSIRGKVTFDTLRPLPHVILRQVLIKLRWYMARLIYKRTTWVIGLNVVYLLMFSSDSTKTCVREREREHSKMTVATDKLVYDISPVKTDSFKLVDHFDYLLKRCNLSGEKM